MPRQPRPLSLRLFKRGDWWHLDIHQHGRRWKEPTHCQKRGEAEAAKDRRRAELGAPDVSARPEACSMTTAVADFQASALEDVAEPTARMYRSKAGHLARLLGDKDVGTLCAKDVLDYVGARAKERTLRGIVKAHTIAKEIVTLRRIMTWLESQSRLAPGWRGIFPAKFQTNYQPRERWLEPEEYLTLLAALPEDRRLWLTAGCFLGGRESELRRLDWREVDFRRGFVLIHSAKCRKGKPKVRHIPLADELRPALEAARRRPDGTAQVSGHVFPDPWTNPALMLTRFARKAGIVGPTETLNDNDMRRTFASWMLQRGATVSEVAKLLGHGSTAMVERVYGHLTAHNLVAAVGRLPRFGGTP